MMIGEGLPWVTVCNKTPLKYVTSVLKNGFCDTSLIIVLAVGWLLSLEKLETDA